jgi:hypothetical protein
MHHVSGSLYTLGRWEEALAIQDELEQTAPGTVFAELSATQFPKPLMQIYRGERPTSSADELAALGSPSDLQARAGVDLARAAALLADGRPREALEAAEAAFGFAPGRHPFSKEAFTIAVEAAFTVGDLARVEELLTRVREMAPGSTPRFLRGHVARFEARLAVRADEADRARTAFVAAASTFREIDVRFWLAMTLLEHAEWLAEHDDDGEELGALVDEARPLLEGMRARPSLDRLERLAAPASAFAPS